MKKELKQKREDLEQIKKNIKLTRTSEMEIEIQSYIQECTRLRHLLEEAFSGRLGVVPNQIEQDPEALREKYIQQNERIKSIKTQTQDLQSALKQKEEQLQEANKKIKAQEILQNRSAKKITKANEQEIQKLKSKILDLEKQVEQQNKQISQAKIQVQISQKQEDKSQMIKTLEDQNAKYQQDIKELNSQIIALKEQLNKNQTKSQEEKQLLNSQLFAIETKNKDLSQQNQQLNEKIKQKQDQMEALLSKQIQDEQIKSQYQESAKQLVKQTSIRQKEEQVKQEKENISESQTPTIRAPQDLLNIMYQKLQQQKISIKEWWNDYVNQDYISVKQFKQALKSIQLDFITEEVQNLCKMFNETDQNSITFQQLKEVWKQQFSEQQSESSLSSCQFKGSIHVSSSKSSSRSKEEEHYQEDKEKSKEQSIEVEEEEEQKDSKIEISSSVENQQESQKGEQQIQREIEELEVEFLEKKKEDSNHLNDQFTQQPENYNQNNSEAQIQQSLESKQDKVNIAVDQQDNIQTEVKNEVQKTKKQKSKSKEDQTQKVSKQDIQDLMKHIALRCQLHRCERKQAVLLLFNNNYDKDRIYSRKEISTNLQKQILTLVNRLKLRMSNSQNQYWILYSKIVMDFRKLAKRLLTNCTKILKTEIPQQRKRSNILICTQSR